MLQFIFEGQEYTTRTRLMEKYGVTNTTLHNILIDDALVKVVDGNKHFYLKNQIESIVERKVKIKK